MTPGERAAYNPGIKAAQIVAITIETANDASTFWKKVAAEALAAFAESARSVMLINQTKISMLAEKINIS